MFGKKPIDFLAIGDIVIDAFIRLKDAHVNCSLNKETCELCMRFGDKIPYESMEEVRAVGNSANAAVGDSAATVRKPMATTRPRKKSRITTLSVPTASFTPSTASLMTRPCRKSRKVKAMFTVVPSTSRKYGYSIKAPPGIPWATGPMNTFGWYKCKADAQKRADELNRDNRNLEGEK